MTANRWWVKSYARWQARIDSSLQEINLGLRMISSGGIGSASLAYLGHQWLVLPFILSLVLGVLVYSYLTFEGGVKNQVARDRADMISDFAGPTMRIDDEMNSRSILAGMKGRPLTEGERQAIKEECDTAFNEYRDGILGD